MFLLFITLLVVLALFIFQGSLARRGAEQNLCYHSRKALSTTFLTFFEEVFAADTRQPILLSPAPGGVGKI